MWKELQAICNFTYLTFFTFLTVVQIYLQQNYFISYTVVPSSDGLWGAMLENGSYNGLVGMLQRNEIDIGLASFIFTSLRFEAIGYLRPLGAYE